MGENYTVASLLLAVLLVFFVLCYPGVNAPALQVMRNNKTLFITIKYLILVVKDIFKQLSEGWFFARFYFDYHGWKDD